AKRTWRGMECWSGSEECGMKMQGWARRLRIAQKRMKCWMAIRSLPSVLDTRHSSGWSMVLGQADVAVWLPGAHWLALSRAATRSLTPKSLYSSTPFGFHPLVSRWAQRLFRPGKHRAHVRAHL